MFLLFFEIVSNVLIWKLPSKSEVEELKSENEFLKDEVSRLKGGENGTRKS